jgi:fermentation-respiration switch protein FrsA (DUF1100 family)
MCFLQVCPALKTFTCLVLLLAVTLFITGCTVPPKDLPQYEVNRSGIVTLSCPEYTVDVSPLSVSGNVTLSRLSFTSGKDRFYALLGSPPHPVAGLVMSPGAGVKKESHADRARGYADQGYAFLVIDVRGNGGETSGHPLDPESDYAAFREGNVPQYYLSVCDMISARKYLSQRFGIPVVHMGDSNGGRYAALAAARDPGSAGYIGISTSGFGRQGDEYTGDARTFLLSIDPEVYLPLISPRPVIIFHSENDPVISFSEGQNLFSAASGPKEFVVFNGTHGIDDEVDTAIGSRMLTFMGARHEGL